MRNLTIRIRLLTAAVAVLGLYVLADFFLNPSLTVNVYQVEAQGEPEIRAAALASSLGIEFALGERVGGKGSAFPGAHLKVK